MQKNAENTKEAPGPSNSTGIETLTQEQATESNAIDIPEIALPKGGGALKGIDEKFQVNPANGTAGFSVPLPITPGRNGFSPSLSLSYNSGGGNSPFGLGWSLDYPMIQRKTDKSLPRYRDNSEEDTFMFSGAEDLVPFLEEKDGVLKYKEKKYPADADDADADDADKYTIKQYRPRIEGGFSRIERITDPNGQVYWKVTSRENITTFFGLSQDARIFDPEDASRIFSWLPELSYDDKGNYIQYHYKTDSNLENGMPNPDESIPDQLCEKNRKSGLAPFTNTYLKSITYGNRAPWYADDPYNPTLPLDELEYFFEVVLDYGEHDPLNPTPQDPGIWDYREDAFSAYRSGFEIRTSRLCRRILIFHHFTEELQFEDTPDQESFGVNYLVRSLDLEYTPSSINTSGQTEVTYLQSITQKGFIRQGGSYFEKSLPPMEFEYRQLEWNTEVRTVDRENIMNAPVGLTNNYQWIDLYGEGINGILSEQAEGWYYKSNLGDTDEDRQVHFTRAEKVIPKPSFTGLSNGILSIQDLESNGQKQVVVNSPGVQGYFELTTDNNYQSFRAFENLAHVNLQDPNTRLLDLNGDGQPEIVMTEDNVFSWYTAKGKKGYAKGDSALKPFDEEQGPAIVFADTQQTIFLADMSGDGLTDIVRIRNGEICYWANKGYGRFSAKISMGNPPLFDHPEGFNPQYLHLADVSGTGATDIVYLGKNKFKAFINLSGNAWSNVHEIDPFFSVDTNTRLSVVDLLGTGTSCIVWSSDLPGEAHAPMRYIDLMDSKKPHVMNKYVNNMGKETTLNYKSSTWFYLKDKLEGTPWITKLPFPVQVVSKSIVEDKITNVRFSAEYAYHHGYYDHFEREFRGFGMVEQLDTEAYEQWKSGNDGNQLEQSEALYQAPTLTKTWFHTGAFLDRETILTHFKSEYWYEAYNKTFPGAPLTLSEPELEDARIVVNQTLDGIFAIEDLNAQEYREALRACKGMTLRQEVFTLDAPAETPTEDELKLQMKPYTVATHNCHIQLLQPRLGNPYASFIVTESEAITIHYERNETDPRIAHSLNTQIDELGNILEAAAVVYPRKGLPEENPLDNPLNDLRNEVTALTYDRMEEKGACLASLDFLEAQQGKTLITYTQNSFTANDIVQDDVYRLRQASETQTFEITGLGKSGELYQLSDFDDILNGESILIGYHQTATSGTERRPVEHIRTLYYDKALTGPMPFGQLPTHGIPYESYQLAYTPDLLTDLFGTKITDPNTLLGTEGKFVHSQGDTNWWIRSGHPVFIDPLNSEDLNTAKSRFFSPMAYRSPFDVETTVSYYKDYFLMLESTEDALQNAITTERFNFRTLSPVRMKDMNDNISEVLTDELGLVKATAILGKGNEADELTGLTEYTSQPEKDSIQTYFTLSDTTTLRAEAQTLLQGATARFVYDFHRYQTSVQLLEEQLATDPATQECAKVKLLPTVVGSITREEHHSVNPNSALQLSFEYSDGTGNVAMAKVQAEPGEALNLLIQPNCDYTLQTVDTGTDLRWIGNGRTVLNNKGNPVKQYEPYFSVNPFYEDHKELVERGVTPIIYYDALGRNIKTELPDGTFTKVEFDSWQQISYDANDTVMDSSWYMDRGSPDPNAQVPTDNEQLAAWKAAKHYNTPSVVHLDTLGRPVLSIAHNRREEDNGQGGFIPIDEWYSSVITLDIEGNARSVTDARGNTVMQYSYDMLGHRVYQNSMDAGEDWILTNVAGNPIRSWDSKDHIFSTTYDVLQRPLEMFVEIGGTTSLIESITYGEGQVDDKANNLRGQAVEYYDSSGRMANIQFDFKGNPLEVQRQLASAYDEEIIDWSPGSPTNSLETETFTLITQYDAMNRMIQLYNWHSNTNRVTVYEPLYNERGVLQAEDHITAAQKTANSYTGGRSITAVSNIEYNEKGQRMRLQYANGTTTRYHYDTQTFRLIQLRTTRNVADSALPNAPSNLSNPDVLQNLYYTYDAAGNITEIEDDAYEPVFFQNQMVEPKSRYTYDALYRLIEATGRENNTFDNAPGPIENTPLSVSFPTTDETLRNYIQKYQYDAVGNILQMRHITPDPSKRWTRNYAYATDSNRLESTWIGNDLVNAITYTYDVHGNMLNYNSTPEEFLPDWNYRDRVHHLNLGGGGDAWYQYDTGGQRSRKRIEKPGNIVEERLYLGGAEIYRRWNGGVLTEEIETHHLVVGSQRVLMVEEVIQTDNVSLSTGILDHYQYGNHLGSVGLELDGSGAIISYEEYHPYGTVAYQAINSTITTTAKRYRYTGMERDTESGLNYHSARYYMPWLARWLSADPIGIGDGVNVYRYTAGNPIKFVDPRGKNKKNFDAGKEWEKKILDKIDKKIPIVQQVTVQAEIEGELVVSVLDALGKDAEGWLIVEAKLSSTTELSDQQKAIRAHLLAGGSVTIVAEKEKNEELKDKLEITSGTTISTSRYYVTHRGNASQVLSELNVIPEGSSTILSREGNLYVMTQKQINDIRKLQEAFDNKLSIETILEKATEASKKVATPEDPRDSVMPNVPPDVSNTGTLPNVPPDVSNTGTLPNVPPDASDTGTLPNIPPDVSDTGTLPNIPPAVPEADWVTLYQHYQAKGREVARDYQEWKEQERKKEEEEKSWWEKLRLPSGNFLLL